MLTELQRRVLGNLAIPRNPVEVSRNLQGVVMLEARKIPTAPDDIDKLLRGGEVAHEHGSESIDPSWVANLGTHDDATQMVSNAQGQADKLNLIPMADEQAQILERRLSFPQLAWRRQGDVWMLTNEGLAQLKAPTPDDRPATVSEIQSFVDAEWARTLKEPYVPGETNLSNMLLLEEFEAWFQMAADDCERTWGVRPNAPMAGGASGYSDAYEIMLLDAENQKTALGAVSDPWYMALSILALTDADTPTTLEDGSHKPTYGGYARKSVAGTDMAAGAGTSGSVSNANAIVFANWTSGSSTVTDCANCSASGATGVLRKWGALGVSVTVDSTHYPAQFAVGQYTTTVA